MYKKSTAKNYKIFFYIHGGIALGFAIISLILLVPFKTEEKTIENSNEKKANEEKEKENNKKYKSGLKLIFSKIRIYKLLFIFLFTSFFRDLYLLLDLILVQWTMEMIKK
jgi:Na+/melibiose symporter-like transporter